MGKTAHDSTVADVGNAEWRTTSFTVGIYSTLPLPPPNDRE